MHLTQRQREQIDSWLRFTEERRDRNCPFKGHTGDISECYTLCFAAFPKIGAINGLSLRIYDCPCKIYPSKYITRRVKHFLKGA